MRNRTFADLDRVVALGGGHGLGRVMSSLSSLGSRLTGIVTTTDNGGSTGRIRRSEGGIAWGRYAQLHQSVNCRAERSVGDV
ncbi:putative phosphatase/sulfatase [Klebsiella pneumoniae]|nr:putative phosphatase/sulfatase [Klebsiella pneumoniae]